MEKARPHDSRFARFCATPCGTDRSWWRTRPLIGLPPKLPRTDRGWNRLGGAGAPGHGVFGRCVRPPSTRGSWPTRSWCWRARRNGEKASGGNAAHPRPRRDRRQGPEDGVPDQSDGLERLDGGRTLPRRYEGDRSLFQEIKQTLNSPTSSATASTPSSGRSGAGLLVHLFVRFLHYLSQWTHSFFRLFALLRACLWGEGPARTSPALWDSILAAALARTTGTGLLPGVP